VAQFFGRNRNRIARDGFQPEPFDDRDGGRGNHDRRRDDLVHARRVEAEHFLDAEPGKDFGFRQHEAETSAQQQIAGERDPGL
jgi:hypothetical protein